MLLRLKRTDGGTGAAPVQVGVNYADFASAFGGDYGSRLALVALDGCTDAGGGEGCVPSVGLDAVNDTEAQTLSVTVTAMATGGEGTLLAVAADAGSDGGTGDYSATKRQPSAEWNVGTRTGGFSWSYPMAAPPVAGEASPLLSSPLVKIPVTHADGAARSLWHLGIVGCRRCITPAPPTKSVGERSARQLSL
ncbi:hypothetical protein LP52_24030 [Streptomonospora alba]|uniref:Uncharacterized protein n=1 Tax=Streptomonospora alba TaxID=183763 RepID=A0A0C2J5B7_9ACTN|nr:hypothetical protein [Streptomonospora alba]KIH96581.1 hypothetical protein LP52_24030 [Streptomonospora alba]